MKRSAISFLTFILCVLCASAVPLRAADADTLALLQSLKPAGPQMGWYSGDGKEWLTADKAIIREVSRLCGSASFRGENATKSIATLAAMTASSLKIPLSIAWSPFMWTMRTNTPPTADACADELAFARGKMKEVAAWIGSVPVSFLILDCEAWLAEWSDDGVTTRWDDVQVSARLQEYSNALREAFPGADQEWYCRGRVRIVHDWELYSYGSERLAGPGLQSYGCNLYAIEYLENQQALLRATIANAKLHRVPHVTPWVALGAGYRRELGWKPWGYTMFETWQRQWEMDAYYPFAMGSMLCLGDRPEPQWVTTKGIVKRVILYPSPFEKDYPLTLRDFARFVAGANWKPLTSKPAN